MNIINKATVPIRKMAWQSQLTYLWHFTFTDRCTNTWPKRSILHSYFYMYLNLGFNEAHEANGPNQESSNASI
jgi:hypothetical protein